MSNLAKSTESRNKALEDNPLQSAADDMPAVTAASYFDPKRKKTAGEKIVTFFKEVVFYFGLNSLLSILITERWKYKPLENLAPGAEPEGSFYTGIKHAGRLFTKLPFLGSSDPEKLQQRQHAFGEGFMDLFGLSSGGWVLLPFRHMLERCELTLVKIADKILDHGKKLTEKESREREYAYASIAAKPKTSFGRLCWQRLKGWVIFNVIPTKLIVAGTMSLRERTGVYIPHAEEVSHGIANYVSSQVSPARRDRVNHFTQVALMEAFGCGLSSLGLVFFKGKDEKKRGKKIAEEEKKRAIATAETRPPISADGVPSMAAGNVSPPAGVKPISDANRHAAQIERAAQEALRMENTDAAPAENKAGERDRRKNIPHPAISHEEAARQATTQAAGAPAMA